MAKKQKPGQANRREMARVINDIQASNDEISDKMEHLCQLANNEDFSDGTLVTTNGLTYELTALKTMTGPPQWGLKQIPTINLDIE